jgi:F0F1-type ATP synthase assembly protein I
MKNLKGIQYLVLLTQIGLNMALPIVGGVYAGAYLDQRFSTGSAFLIFGTFLGVFSGIAGVYRLISLELRKKSK